MVWKVVLCVFLLAGCMCAQEQVPRANSTSIKFWAPGFMSAGNSSGSVSSHPQSPSQIANNYDLIVFGGPISSRETMFKANEKLIILKYINGGFSTPFDRSKYKPESYAYTAQDEPIYAAAHEENQLMNPKDITRRNALTLQCQETLTQTYSGCFFDTIGKAPTSESYVTPGVPVYPGTSIAWTAKDWMQDQADSMAYISANVSAPIMGNCLGDGLAYFSADEPTTILFNSLPGAMMEQFLRGPYDPYDVYPSEKEFNATVYAMIDSELRGKAIYTVTKMWLDNGTEYSSYKNAWHRYALATFFLGTHEKAYFNLQYSNDNASAFQFQKWWNTDIGKPTTRHYVNNGVYMRNFPKGIALVNPTKNPIAINLDGKRYVNLAGDVVNNPYIVPKTYGDILVYSPLPTPAPTSKATATPTSRPTAVPTKAATSKPTSRPTAKPTAAPSPKPSAKPTAAPSPKPSAKPTAAPSPKPSAKPSAKPSTAPTASPTSKPTVYPTPKPNGLIGQYFSGSNFQTLEYSRLDATVNFNWGAGSPTGLPINMFSIKWTGYLTPPASDAYTFYVTSNDGSRLSGDGVLLIDDWNIRNTAQTSQTTRNLNGGQRYAINLEFFEQVGDASIKLEWSSSTIARQVVPASVLSPN